MSLLAKRLLYLLGLAVVLLVLLGMLGGVGMTELVVWLIALTAGLGWAVWSARRRPADVSSP